MVSLTSIYCDIILQLYQPIGIRVVLIEVITWVSQDEIDVSPDPNTLLDRLESVYRPQVATPHDSLMLLTYANF